jgi:alpha-1,6-mannosyltransferase
MLTRPSLVTNFALALVGLAMVALCRQGVNEIHHFVIGFGLIAMLQALLYLVAVWVVLNRPADRWTFVIILVCAIACRLVCLFSPPFLSSDIFRYVWDGKVQAAGINPFRYIPADSHLAFLRDVEIYPHINRRDYAHTIYPPGAQMLFLLITRIGASVRWMKAGMVGLEALTILILVKLLQALGLRREQVLI